MPAPKREQLYKADLVRVIRHYMFDYNYNMAQTAQLAGFAIRTFYDRMRNPGDFSLDEINRIARVLKIPAKELSPILTWEHAS